MMKTGIETLNTNVEQTADATVKPENIQEAKVSFLITFLNTFELAYPKSVLVCHPFSFHKPSIFKVLSF